MYGNVNDTEKPDTAEFPGRAIAYRWRVRVPVDEGYQLPDSPDASHSCAGDMNNTIIWR